MIFLLPSSPCFNSPNSHICICMSFSDLLSVVLILPMIFTYHSEALCSQMLSSMLLKYLYALERSWRGVKEVWPESMLWRKREDEEGGTLFSSQVWMSSYDKKDSKLLQHFSFSYSLLSYQKFTVSLVVACLACARREGIFKYWYQQPCFRLPVLSSAELGNMTALS